MKKILAIASLFFCVTSLVGLNSSTKIVQETVVSNTPEIAQQSTSTTNVSGIETNLVNTDSDEEYEELEITYDLASSVDGIAVVFDAYGTNESFSYVLYDRDGLGTDTDVTSCGDIAFATAGNNKTFTVMVGPFDQDVVSTCYNANTDVYLDTDTVYDISFYTSYGTTLAENGQQYLINIPQTQSYVYLFTVTGDITNLTPEEVDSPWYTKWFWWVGIAAIVTGTLSIGMFGYDFYKKKKDKNNKNIKTEHHINKEENINNNKDNHINKEEAKNSI